jgi:ATP synthase protein I
MTTESKPGTRTGVPPLLGALASGAIAVIVLVVVASLTDGRAAVVGAATGGVVTLAVFALGIAVVGLVARVMPGASLLVALMTYALQLLVLALVVASLERADVSAETLSRGWFAAGVIAVTLLWMVGQLVAATRQRIPAYETREDASAAGEQAGHPGGES